MKQLVIGLGEVGSAMARVLNTEYVIDTHKNIFLEGPHFHFDVMHICFPYSEDFIKEVEAYQNTFKPLITIIHSSVPIGTSEKVGAVHSPVRGVHPNLEEGIRTFVKYFGGEKAMEAAEIFANLGIMAHAVPFSRTTEALKLWDTTQYGVMILLEKEIHKFCQDNGLDFETIYADANRTYNNGYTALGMGHVNRPFLRHMTGPIGGHCVVQNAELLDSPLAKLILERNAQLSEGKE